MAEYIEKEAAIDACFDGWNNTADDCAKNIKRLPTADVVKVRHAKDVYKQYNEHHIEQHCDFMCSICGGWIGVIEGGICDFNYCPNCGAKMEEAENRMREILFRGKSRYTGEWLEGYFGMKVVGVPYIQWLEYDDKYHEEVVEECAVILDTVGQYTGVTDKNDKKIFEHDIVRIAVGGIYANHVVSYEKENARFVVGDIDFTMVRIFSPKIEVIGNIHDNKNLLKNQEVGE